MVSAAAPADMEEMFRSYSGYVRGLVVKLGVPYQEAEDVAADIMARLYERDLIGMFDPEHRIERNGEVIPAKFKSFLSHQVALYVRGKRDAITKRQRRELLILDQPADQEGMSTLAELLGGKHEDDYSKPGLDDFVGRARQYLGVVSQRNSRDMCNLVELFDEMVREVQEDGEFSYATIQERFGISSTSAYTWVSWLREALANATTHLTSCHVVGGVILTEADIRRAVKLLRAAGGSSVMKPLVAANHKLATAQDGWHKELARLEKRQFPPLAEDVGKPDQRRPGVKLAVIHRLERMLPGSPSPSVATPEKTEPELSPWEAVEAELWRAGADKAAVGRIFGMVSAAMSSGEAVPAWS